MQSHKKSTALFALFAMGMAFFAQISPLWLKNAQGMPIVICTALGYQTIIIDENGNEIPSPVSSTKNNCALCLNAFAYGIIPNIKLASDILPYQNISKLKWRDNASTISTDIHTAARAIRAPPHTS